MFDFVSRGDLQCPRSRTCWHGRSADSNEAQTALAARLRRLHRPQNAGFNRRLLKWYQEHGRDLPWRKTSNPYHILVSEVMLQQTQVDRVIPKYHEFLERYPGFEELAGPRDRCEENLVSARL